MAVVISAMAPSYTPSLTLHGSSRLSRASSGAMLAPPPPLLSLQLQAQQLCREEDACARFQETPPPPHSLVSDVEAPISNEDIERLAPLFCDEEITAMFKDEEIQAIHVLCAVSQEASSSMQFSGPRSDDHLAAGKTRMPSSPPWPSCIADGDDGEEAGPPLLASLPPPPAKKARTQMKRSARREHGLPALLPPPLPIKAEARFQTKSRSRRQHAAASAAQLRKWHNKIATRILTRQFDSPGRRTALRCQCPELSLVGCCALHQDVLPEDLAWMYSADQGHGAPPLVGGPGVVLVPSVGSSKATVLQYARWRRSVWLPTRFYVQRTVEKWLARQQHDDDWTMPEY